MKFTPEEDVFYRDRLIHDLEVLIKDFEVSYSRRGQTFGMWFSGEQGRLIMAALRTSLQYQLDQKAAKKDSPL